MEDDDRSSQVESSGDESSDDDLCQEEKKSSSEEDLTAVDPSQKTQVNSKGKKSRPKVTRKPLKFSPVLLLKKEFLGWLCEDENDRGQYYCKPCKKQLHPSNQKDLKTHCKRKIHQKNVRDNKFQPAANDREGMSERERQRMSTEEGTKRLELGLAAYLGIKKLAHRLMDDLPAFLKAFIPDSKIVKGIKCGRTKTTALIVNVIAPAGETELLGILRRKHFSIIVDESTDLSIIKYLVIIVRYFCDKQQKPVEEYLGMPVVTDATAIGLKKLILDHLESRGVPKTNIIGFASDNASVMLGREAGLAVKLKEDGLPELAIFGCICHSLALCAAAACDKLDQNFILFANEVYK